MSGSSKGPAPGSPSSQGMPLGKTSDYVDQYTPELLFPLSRAEARAQLQVYPALKGIEPAAMEVGLEFLGEDIWTAYELSWLDRQGRPQAAVLELRAPCESPCIVESKSMKLCLNSLAQTRFANAALVEQTLTKDLGLAFGAPIQLKLLDIEAVGEALLPAQCIDGVDVEIQHYSRNPQLLQSDETNPVQRMALVTHQFRSLCPVTGQPDFASLWLEYSGPRIATAGLFAYLVSYRNHSGFHESAIEQIFLDLQHYCGCSELSLYGRFMRRGGIDINPYRSTHTGRAPQWRLARQ